MEGVIPIALSYRIIKNTRPVDQQERKLESLDVSVFRQKNEERYLETAEDEGVEEDYLSKIKKEVRNTLKLEMESERAALMAAAREEIEKEREAAFAEGLKRPKKWRRITWKPTKRRS